MSVNQLIGTVVRLTLLMTPFFVLAVFISCCEGWPQKARSTLARRTGVAVMVICMVIYLIGETLFRYLGISLDAFRIGAGLVLLLNGVSMVRETSVPGRQVETDGDISVVPLALPTTVGPGTIGALLVMGAAAHGATEKIVGLLSIAIASTVIFLVLNYSEYIARIIKHKGITILSKLTGMYLVALAAQIIFEGVRNFLRPVA
ncbi:MAG: MarC family protein [Lentisphaeria bacterium]|nr:MarC family protein [Lentisphaeria bacterium]